MQRIDLRLPEPAIRLLDAMKYDYPHIQNRPSRSSVIISLILSTPGHGINEAFLREELALWIDENELGTT